MEIWRLDPAFTSTQIANLFERPSPILAGENGNARRPLEPAGVVVPAQAFRPAYVILG